MEKCFKYIDVVAAVRRGEIMKSKYSVFGNKKQGYRIAIPTKAKVADEYEITTNPPGYPDGTLVYVPVVK